MQTKSNRYTGVWLAALALAVACEQIQAADFHVSTAQQLQNALTTAAHNGANNNIYLTNGYYGGNFNYNSSAANNLTLLAEPGLTNTGITIDGAGVGSGLYISNSAGVNTITVEGVSFAINSTMNVGALEIAGGSQTTILVNGCRFFTPAKGAGFGLMLLSGLNATVNGCTVSGGPRYGVCAAPLNGNITVQNSGFSGNAGGVYVSQANSITISNNNFTGNGDILYLDGPTPTASITQNTFSGNGTGAVFSGNGTGAIIYNQYAVTLTGNTFTTNICAYGTVFLGSDMNVALSGNSFIGNLSNSDGGGVEITDSEGGLLTTTNVTITGNTFIGNTTLTPGYTPSLSGGAIYVDLSAATVTVQANTFTQNTAIQAGGALYVSAPTVTIADNLLAGNTQTSESSTGGGVWVDASSELFFINNTVTGNTSAGGGGGVTFQVGGHMEVLNVFNNIIWGNSGSPGADVWLAGTGQERIFSYNDADGFFRHLGYLR